MKRDIILGIDGGTGSIRAGLFDFTGHELAFASTEYETIHKHPGWAEQRQEDWWQALKESIGKALKKAQVNKDRILALAVDTTCCSVIACMKDGTPLRDCIIWMDVRASKEVDDMNATGNEAIAQYGGPTIAECMPCKLMWIKRNEPEIYEKAEVFCEYQDWLMHRLTGFWSFNPCNATGRWYYDGVKEEFPKSLYEACGIGDALNKFPPKCYMPGENLGKITKYAADELGLDGDTIVVQGAVDAQSGVIGMGVRRPGKVSLVTGSSHIIMTFSDRPLKATGYVPPQMDGMFKGYGMMSGGQTSSGSILSWFKSNFAGDLLEKAKTEGKSAYWYLDNEAKKIPPGSEGLLVLDWWQGNRDPYADTNIRGMIYGLSLNHTRGHIFRAIMEGIAYGTNNNLECFKKDGFDIKEVIAGGGITNSELFMQIHADVSNLIINVPEQKETPTLGNAILAAVGVGIYKDVPEAINNMVRYTKVIRPNYDNYLQYKEIFKQYAKAYPQFKDWMHETNTVMKNK